MESAEQLRLRIESLEAELHHLRDKLTETESLAKTETAAPPWKWPLSADDYERYHRQLILTQFGVQGQQRLKRAAVLIVGCGGLGCPAAAYLAGAGVGTIGLVDGDKVEMSNLHRQIIHSVERVGMSKVESAICYLRRLNPTLTYRGHDLHLDSSTAADVISQYDLVLDCTDHPTSRYLISDACVLLRKPLVFASALRVHGQLMVLNNPARAQGDSKGGPCYRCVFPTPSPPDTVTSCGEGGILGPVVGVMGVLQALKAINIITDGQLDDPVMATTTPTATTTTTTADDDDEDDGKIERPSMLLLSGHVATPFRSALMAGRRPGCFACGGASELTLGSLQAGAFDYVAFCGVVPPVRLLRPEERISAAEYHHHRQRSDEQREAHVLLDVRETEHFNVANLDGAINVPFRHFMTADQAASARAGQKERQDNLPDWFPEHLPHTAPIYVVCRQGEDSQHVTKRLKDMGLDRGGERFIGDIKGGLRAWKEEVDSTFPFA